MLAGALLLVVAALPGLGRLRLETRGGSLVPRGAPELRADREVRAAFGLGDPIFVVVDTGRPEGIFAPAVLARVRELTIALADLPGLAPGGVVSLASERIDRHEPGQPSFPTFLDPLPETAAGLARLRRDLDAYRIFDGLLVSADRGAASVIVRLAPEEDAGRRIAEIERIAARHRGGPARIDVVGAPVAEVRLGSHILADLGVPQRWLGPSAEGAAAPSGLAGRWGLVPLVIALMGAVFALCFRSAGATVLPLAEVGLCQLFVFGVMGWIGTPVYLVTAALPVLLIALGATDEIYIFSTLLRRAAEGEAAGGLVRGTLGEVRPVIWRTSLTTVVGFLSFALTPIVSVRAFGLYAALGLLFSLGWSLLVTPACLTVAGGRLARGLRRRRPRGLPGMAGALERWAGAVMRHRRATLAALAGVAALAALAAGRVEVQDSWEEGFSPASPFRQATERVNRGFLGTHLLYLAVESGGVVKQGRLPATAVAGSSVVLPRAAGEEPRGWAGLAIELRSVAAAGGGMEAFASRLERPRWTRIAAVEPMGETVRLRLAGSPLPSGALPGRSAYTYRIAPRRLLDPAAMAAVCGLSPLLSGLRDPDLGGIRGPCEHAATLSYIARSRDERARRVPADERGLAWVWDRYEVLRGPDRRAEVIGDDFGRAVATVYLKDANYVAVGRMMAAVRRYERERLRPLGLTVRFAGDVAVSQALIGGIVRTQTASLAGSLLGIAALAWLWWRSWRWAVVGVLPCALALLVQFGAMGLLGIPLGVASAMFSAMVLGVGVDYAFHLIETWDRLAGGSGDRRQAMREAVRQAGPAVVVNGLAIALGFGVLAFSSIPANARLGGFLALDVAVCLAVTLTLLPALAASLRPGGAAAPPGLPAQRDCR